MFFATGSRPSWHTDLLPQERFTTPFICGYPIISEPMCFCFEIDYERMNKTKHVTSEVWKYWMHHCHHHPRIPSAQTEETTKLHCFPPRQAHASHNLSQLPKHNRHCWHSLYFSSITKYTTAILPGQYLIKQDKVTKCRFCIYLFDNSFDQSKSMVRLVRAEKMVLSGLVFARKIARMILIQNI